MRPVHRSTFTVIVAASIAVLRAVALDAQGPSCVATSSSMTPQSWRGREAGNTHYDSVSHCIVVAVQTKNQLVAIDPATEQVVARYDVAGSDHPHGFVIDQPGRLAFVTGEGNGTLQVIDLRTMRVLSSHRVGDDPDVLAWDPLWRRLYVASESGVLSTFAVDGSTLRPLGELGIPHAHTVAVDPKTHRVYLPLENMGGRPVLRILAPGR
jgi:DNA-binding beta-propeller fold protein YncE